MLLGGFDHFCFCYISEKIHIVRGECSDLSPSLAFLHKPASAFLFTCKKTVELLKISHNCNTNLI